MSLEKTNGSKSLKRAIIKDMKDRGVYNPVDDHLIDLYVAQKSIVDDLMAELEDGEVVGDAAGRNSETVANPALVRLPSMLAALNQMAKLLSIGPYSRKLTTGSEQKKPETQTKASMLRPIDRSKKKIG